ASPPVPSAAITAMRDRLSRTADSGTLPALPDNVTAWLAELVLLYGVPLEYIVPNAALLPTESLRFFYLDQNWQRRLIDGALSIGLGSSADALSLLATYEDSVLDALSFASGVRGQRRGKTARVEAGAATGTITGFLLRSSVVSGWPGMEVSAYADPTSAALPLLRLERITSDVLLGLIDGLPSEVNFLEPPEGLHFGIIPSGDNDTVYLRGLGYGGYSAGIQITSAPAVTLTPAGRAAGVFDIAASAASLVTALEAQNALSPSDPFTSAEFAIQMTRGAGLQIFQWPTGAGDSA
ncbi:MAG: hypothetical protein ACOVKO_08215, partial [Elstera sp.]